MSRLDLGRKRQSCHSCRWLLPARKPPSPRPCPRDTGRGSGNLRAPREGMRAASGTVSPPGPDEARVHVTPWRPGRGLEQRARGPERCPARRDHPCGRFPPQ